MDLQISDLRRRLRQELDRAVDELRKTGSFGMHLVLTKRDGSVEFIGLLGDAANNDEVKSAVGKRVREQVAQGEVVSTVLLSDTFWANISPENDKIRRALRLNVEQSAAVGLCEKYEAVVACLESPIYNAMMRQQYHREGERIELDGLDDLKDGSDYRVEHARLSGFFLNLQEGKA